MFPDVGGQGPHCMEPDCIALSIEGAMVESPVMSTKASGSSGIRERGDRSRGA